MISQADVAKTLGLSQTAVSLALRNSPSIPKATIARVQQAAMNLGYRPDPLIAVLMAQRRKRLPASYKAKIAFLTGHADRSHWERSPYSAGCFAGAKAALASRGYACEPFWLNEPGINHQRLSQILWSQNVQGLIIAPLPTETSSIEIEWDRFASVSLDYSLRSPHLHRVVDDHSSGLERILAEIGRRGYRRPGLVIRASQDIRTHHSRLGSYLAAQHLYSAWTAIPPLILPEDRWDRARFCQWFSDYEPDVVLTEEEELMAAVEAIGLRIPEDVGIAFFHQERPSNILSGIEVDSSQIGARAAEVLVRLIETNERGIPNIPTTTLVEAYSWHEGGTLGLATKAVAGNRRKVTQISKRRPASLARP